MVSFPRAILQTVLFATTISLFACDNSTEATNGNEAPDTAMVATNAAGSITADKPRIRATAPGQTVSGAFMTLVNSSANAHTLTSVSYNDASAVEIHETSMNEGRMRMRKLSDIEIPANGSVELKPGSYHIMLIGLKKDMKPGAVEVLTLTFSDDSQKTVEALVGTLSE